MLFGLSGYFIYRELCGDGVSLRSYYKKRLLRIVPVYYVVLGMYVAVGLLPLSWKIWRYFLFMNAVVPSDNYQLYNNMGAFWTMGSFMLWYLLAPLLQKLVHNLKQSVLALVIMFAVGRVAKVLLELIYMRVGADEVGFMTGNNPVCNMYFFCVGMVAYYVIKEAKIYEGILICITAIMFLTYINSPWYPYWSFLTVIFILLAAVVPMKVPDLLYRVIVFLSGMSFDFYLVHMGCIRVLDRAGFRDTHGSRVFVLCATVVSFAAAVMVYYLERLMLGRSRKKQG